jgi:hypothetical protein
MQGIMTKIQFKHFSIRTVEQFAAAAGQTPGLERCVA